MGVMEFAEKVKDAVLGRLGEGYEVRIQKVCKNNGVYLQGVVILAENTNISPTIYLNSFLEAYEAGVDFDVIIDKILSIYEEDTPKENVDMTFFKDFEQVKERICFKLISAGRNEELLEKIPHMEYLDLAICFFYAYEGATLGCGSILIHNSHLKMWKADVEDLWELALVNTPKIFPCECSSLEAVLREMMDEGISKDDGMPMDEDASEEEGISEEEEGDFLPMKILSNQSRVFGASSILYPEILENLAEERACNFYIIPSSIHEVILLPDAGEDDADYLRGMIAEVNGTQVEPEEVLSNQLYYYDRNSKKVAVI